MSLKPLTKPRLASKVDLQDELNLEQVDLGWTLNSDTMQLTTELMRSRAEQVQQTEKATLLANRMVRLLEVLPGGVIVLDGEGKVQQCNKAAISLLGEPLEGELWTKVIARSFSIEANQGHDVALNNGRFVHISTSPLEDEPGQIVLLNDVTETRQLQMKVSHLQRLSAMGEMAARLAHQIRTPLSSAMLYLSPLMKDKTTHTVKQRFAKKLHSSITHMESLVKDMLAFSRGDMAMTGPVAIEALFATVKQQFMSSPDAKQYNFQLHNLTKDSTVFGSQDALASALNNLINNAKSACGEQGEISLYAESVEDEQGIDCIEISVEDNGSGIPEHEQDKILAPFYTTRSSGTGLGLAVVKSIAQAHRGNLWFASDEGEGSTFCIRLPLYQSADNFTLKAQKK